MPVPNNITDLSTTPAANSPAGSESPQLIDDYLRTQGAFIAQLRDEAKSRSFAVAAAGGTADAITATFSPAVTSLTNGMTLYVRAALANTTSTPTFSPNGLAATTIVRANNQPLTAGDIAGAGHWLELQYDSTLAKWVLQNPLRPDLASKTYVDSTIDALIYNNIYMPMAWVNSDFSINQRGLTTLADGAYGPDRTYALTQSGNVSYTTLTAPTDGIPFAARFTQPDATAKRFGFAQIQEARNTYAYRGSDFALNPKVRCSSATTMRVALLAHTGTADTLSKDVVNDWTSAVYEAGAFFKTGLVVLDTKSVMCAANTWTDVPTWANVNSSANNLIMFCWTEGTAAQNFTLDTSTIRAGRGRDIGLWLPPDPAQEMVRSKRFYYREAPSASNTATGWQGQAISGSGGFVSVRHPVEMRIAPALTWSGGSITSASAASLTILTVALNNSSPTAANIQLGVSSGLVAGDAFWVFGTLSAEFNAEIGT